MTKSTGITIIASTLAVSVIHVPPAWADGPPFPQFSQFPHPQYNGLLSSTYGDVIPTFLALVFVVLAAMVSYQLLKRMAKEQLRDRERKQVAHDAGARH